MGKVIFVFTLGVAISFLTLYLVDKYVGGDRP